MFGILVIAIAMAACLRCPISFWRGTACLTTLPVLLALSGCWKEQEAVVTAAPLETKQNANSNAVDASDNVILASPSELRDAFARDAKYASNKYRGHLISVTGDVERVVRMDGFVDATLHRGGPGKIEVSFDERVEDADRVAKGQTISVACPVIDNFETSILLRRCDGLMILDKD